MKEIKQGAMMRRLAIGVAGAKGGAGLLASRAGGLLLSKEEREKRNSEALEREAMRFVSEVGKLKGAYVKIGQMLALYGEHILPAPVTKALHTLGAQTTALSWSSVQDSVPDNWIEMDIDPQAFAAASLAQVHRAKLGTRDVCLKIQYPGIADAIDDDFKHLMQMLRLASWVKSGRHLEQVSQELKRHLVIEVDYQQELSKAIDYTRLLRGDSRFLVPGFHAEYCDSSHLVMDYIEGVDVTSTEVAELSQARRNRLAEAMLDLFFKESFEWGLMQTDPNFGNYRIAIDPHGEDDKLVLLDFGSVHKMPDSFTQGIKQTILNAWLGNDAEAIEGLIRLKCLRAEDSEKVKQSFVEFCRVLLEPFQDDSAAWPNFAKTSTGHYDWAQSKLMKRAGKHASKNMLLKGFNLPPAEFILLTRKLTGVFTFISVLSARFNATPFVERYL